MSFLHHFRLLLFHMFFLFQKLLTIQERSDGKKLAIQHIRVHCLLVVLYKGGAAANICLALGNGSSNLHLEQPILFHEILLEILISNTFYTLSVSNSWRTMNKILRRERGTLHPNHTSLITLIKAGLREGTLQHPPEIMVAAEHREHRNCGLLMICVLCSASWRHRRLQNWWTSKRCLWHLVRWSNGMVRLCHSVHQLRVCVSVCIYLKYKCIYIFIFLY